MDWYRYTYLAITVIKHRLEDAFATELSQYEVIGDPKDLYSAIALSKQDKYQFEWWALDLVDAIPTQDKKKGAEKEMDGYIKFFDDTSEQAKKIVIQVKSGHVNVSQIRDLIGVIEREKAAIGVFITLKEPTKNMKEEAIGVGLYVPEFFPEKRYLKLQILTIEEILNGKKIQYFSEGTLITHKKTERKSKTKSEQISSL